MRKDMEKNTAWTKWRTTGLWFCSLATLLLTCATAAEADAPTATAAADSTERILSQVRKHDFHPIRDGFTFDRHLNTHGVASLNDQDWRVRTLAVRDLVRLDAPGTP